MQVIQVGCSLCSTPRYAKIGFLVESPAAGVFYTQEQQSIYSQTYSLSKVMIK